MFGHSVQEWLAPQLLRSVPGLQYVAASGTELDVGGSLRASEWFVAVNEVAIMLEPPEEQHGDKLSLQDLVPALCLQPDVAQSLIFCFV